MKTFTAKTVDDALKNASEELGIEVDQLIYTVKEEKTGFFSKKAVIDVYEFSDAVEYAQEYLKTVILSLGIESVETSATLNDEIIKISIESSHNPILIGKQGATLQALNELVRLAVSFKFKHRYRILLDVGNYKDRKYSKIASAARKTAKKVQTTRVDATLEPMSSDERRIVHNVLTKFSHIRTESSGEGKNRAVTIKYVEEN